MKPLKYLKTIVIGLIYLIISLPVIFAQELNLQYDQVGNLVTGDSSYREYDGFNHLIRIRSGNLSSGNISEEFIWHPTEERVFIKKIYWNNQTLRSTIKYLNENTIKIKNESGIFYENYIYQDDTLVAQVDANGNKQAVHNDNLGSVSLITDASGNVIENEFFSPYGEQITAVKNSRFSFTGKEFDSVNNEYDFLSRRSKPEWANRLTTPDRIFYDFTKYELERLMSYYNPQGLNGYTYVLNSPYRHTDPTGHQPVSQADDNAVDNFPQRIFGIWVYRHLEKSGALPKEPEKVGVFYDDRGLPYLDYASKHKQEKDKESKPKQSTSGTFVPPEAEEERKELCERANIDCGQNPRIKPKTDAELLKSYITKQAEEKKEGKSSSSSRGSSGGSPNVDCTTTCTKSCDSKGHCSAPTCTTHCVLKK